MDYTKPAKSQTVTCPHCSAELEQVSGAGRVRRYCSPEAGRTYRRRMRALGFPI
ncbi:hypothetical protein ACFVTC_01920 [Streptomyces sp. NPDC057950]|uniref:hypothetical protein n=1 Tax=unclassified Streptomyces TaxID=2593676 RepID=UPI003430AD83